MAEKDLTPTPILDLRLIAADLYLDGDVDRSNSMARALDQLERLESTLEAELREAREDTARLDWLCSTRYVWVAQRDTDTASLELRLSRAAIDSAKEEG